MRKYACSVFPRAMERFTSWLVALVGPHSFLVKVADAPSETSVGFLLTPNDAVYLDYLALGLRLSSRENGGTEDSDYFEGMRKYHIYVHRGKPQKSSSICGLARALGVWFACRS